MLSNLSRQTQLIILGVLLVALCGVYYYYMVTPIRTDLESVRQEIASLEEEVAQGEAVRAELAQLKQSVEEQRNRLAHLREVLPEKKETAEIIRRVQELATQSDLKLKSFTPRPTINNGFYEDWPILMAMEGNYDALGVFFEEISKFTRIINVEDISIRQLSEEQMTRERTLTATCTATTFVFLEEEQEEGPTPSQAGGG